LELRLNYLSTVSAWCYVGVLGGVIERINDKKALIGVDKLGQQHGKFTDTCVAELPYRSSHRMRSLQVVHRWKTREQASPVELLAREGNDMSTSFRRYESWTIDRSVTDG